MKKFTFLVASLFFSITVFLNPSHAAVVVPTANTGSDVVVTPTDSASVKSAVSDFKSLSHKEKKERLREVKKEMKAFKASKRHGEDPSTNTLLLVILAILLPPLAVYLHEGEINTKFWIDLLLTLLFYLPGMIYALIVVLNKD